MNTQAIPCLRRVEPSALLCAPKGETELDYVPAEHTAERGVLATAALHRRLALVPASVPPGQVLIIGRMT